MEKGLNQRLLIIGIVVAIGAILIWPPQERLRPGLDIAGGTSMIFEIEEDASGPASESIAEQMKVLLQKRVDPKGVYDLVWRVVGRNRIEVQMPLAPADNAARKKAFAEAEEALREANPKPSDLERLIAADETTRATIITELGLGNPAREERLRKVLSAAAARDAAAAALAAFDPAAQPASQPATDSSQPAPPAPRTKSELELALREAADSLEDAFAAVFELNIDANRLRDTLDMDENSPIRKQSLADFKRSAPALEKQIDAVIATYQAWRANRAYLESKDDLIRLMRGAGVLEFRMLTEPDAGNPTKFDRHREQLANFGPRAQSGDVDQWYRIDNPQAFLNVNSAAALAEIDPKAMTHFIVDRWRGEWYVLAQLNVGLLADKTKAPWKLVRAGESRDRQGRRCVTFELDTIGGARFREMTRANINKQMGIFVDDVAYSAANINSEIGTHGEIVGDFSQDKIAYLINTMQAGSLPGKLKDTPISERTVGSSLGQTNLRLAFRAGMIGLALVLSMMIVYYTISGAIANVAMLMNLMLTLAAMAMLGARFNLAGIAGIILSLGMAVDANILIFERMREEKERGASLRMIIRNGYDKALSTILDANITTLLTCLILYYVGSEEIKGFGLTLGWGIVLNIFTAVFVTRTIYMLLIKFNLIKTIHMMKMIGVPNIDWYGMRKVFIPVSICITLFGLGLLGLRGSRDLFDVEFLGGVSAEFQIKDGAADLNDITIRRKLGEAGREIKTAGEKLANAAIEPVAGDVTAFRVRCAGVEPPLLAAMLGEPLEAGESGELLQRNGIEPVSDGVVLRVKENVTAEGLRDAITKLADNTGDSIPKDGEDLALANIGQVLESGGEKGRFFNITTTVTNKALVRHALIAAVGADLQTAPRITYQLATRNDRPIPVDNRALERILSNAPPTFRADVADFQGGVVFDLHDVEPPLSVGALRDRAKNIRLQPEFADLPSRTLEVFGVEQAGASDDGTPTYKRLAVTLIEPAFLYRDDPELWYTAFASHELDVLRATLDREQSLRKITAFKPQIAAQSQAKALIALVFSWLMIIAYMWVRFGNPRYGTAGVVALLHDVGIALAFIGISGWIGGAAHPIGSALLIDDFKIDMTIVAALLTLIGFSINDTIVIFDRIRESRGRLGRVTPEMINSAVNQTLSRTILTSTTVFLVLMSMYIFGGPSIRGFNYCMLVGVLTGTYSSVAIAAPLLLFRLGDKHAARL